jgi:hypothetical protein
MIRIVSFLIISLILSFPVSAQWQVDSGAIPVGKGPGKVGFGSVPAINVTIRAPTMAALRGERFVIGMDQQGQMIVERSRPR